METKYCEACNNLLIRKEKESKYFFKKRRFCNYSCRSKTIMIGNKNALGGKSRLGQTTSIETRIKISKALKGKYTGEKSHLYSKQLSDETKKKMSLAKSREKHPRWQGGEYKTNGYIYIFKPIHKRANKSGYIKRSLFVLENKLQRDILKKEIVHHVNCIRDDDRPENLMAIESRSEHMKLHNIMRRA